MAQLGLKPEPRHWVYVLPESNSDETAGKILAWQSKHPKVAPVVDLSSHAGESQG